LTERPKIVFVVADSPWPASMGSHMRRQQLHRALARSGDVRTLIFRRRGLIEPGLLPEATTVVDSPLPPPGIRRVLLRARGLLGRRHPFVEHLERRAGPAALAALLEAEPANVVVLEYPCFGRFVDVARAAGSRVIVDIDTASVPVARDRLTNGRGLGVKARAIGDLLVAARTERRAAGADEAWIASADEERSLPAEFHGRLRVVPNVIAVDAYTRRPLPDPLPRSVGYVGSYDYTPNALAARRLVDGVLPKLVAAEPDARALLIGRLPVAWMVERSRTATHWELRANVADPMTDLAEAGILVVPLTAGGGTKYKIIEATASGIPVVTTRVGLRGLDLRPGVDVLLADTDDEIAAAVLRLWNDRALVRRLTDSAFSRARGLYGPDALERVVGQSIEMLTAPRERAEPGSERKRGGAAAE
jgi:glycosyltransferase involved in cell wall biosynthesis